MLNEFAAQRVVAGLYGHGAFLYVLTREPSAAQGTEWRLFQLDPERGTYLGSVRLPTNADHVSILPAEPSWYVVERSGSLEEWGQQQINQMLQIPKTWIERPQDSPLSSSAPMILQCPELKRQ